MWYRHGVWKCNFQKARVSTTRKALWKTQRYANVDTQRTYHCITSIWHEHQRYRERLDALTPLNCVIVARRNNALMIGGIPKGNVWQCLEKTSTLSATYAESHTVSYMHPYCCYCKGSTHVFRC